MVYTEEIRTKADEMLLSGASLREVLTELRPKCPKLTENTVRIWRQQLVDNYPEEYEDMRMRRKTEFIETAWNAIQSSQAILERRLNRALEDEDLLDDMLDKMSDVEMSEAERREMYKKFEALRVEDIGKLSTVLGTLYDKQALANREETVVLGGKVGIKFEDL